jgi:hypothetical protein
MVGSLDESFHNVEERRPLASRPVTDPHAEQATNLKQAFEAALHELGGAKTGGAGRPICPRKKLPFRTLSPPRSAR